MVAIHPQAIDGNWTSGIALDFHTTTSKPIGYNEAGHMQFETIRPEIAELLYQMKYKGSRGSAAAVIEAAANFLTPHRSKFDVLVTVPASTPRPWQPVLVLAEGIGAALNLPVSHCITTTRPTTQLKSVTDPEKRKELLDGLYAIQPGQTEGKKVLLFDDLFRSGATMNAIAGLILADGKARNIRAFTITKTRSNQ